MRSPGWQRRRMAEFAWDEGCPRCSGHLFHDAIANERYCLPCGWVEYAAPLGIPENPNVRLGQGPHFAKPVKLRIASVSTRRNRRYRLPKSE